MPDVPPPAAAPRRLGDVLAAGAAHLERRGVEDARLVFEWLAAGCLDCPRLELHRQYGRELGDGELEALRDGLRRLARGEPVQYVLGWWEFRGHRLKVDGRALIPRPETERLVQLALDEPAVWTSPHPMVADAGTGSGCIAVSLALERPAAQIVASDPSREALDLARANADALGVAPRIRFVCGPGCGGIETASCDAVLANLPYIPTSALASLPRHVREYEPREALDGGPDGLAVIRDAARDAVMALRPGGRIFLEIGADQATAVRALLTGLGFADVREELDLAGLPRFVCGRFSGP
jgi:release factor glutamine methyltransferase